MNRDKEHCTDSHNECPVIRFIEDVLQVKLLPYQKLLVTHVFETNECKRLNLCSDCRTKMEKKMDDTVSRQEATDALRKMQTYKMFEGDDVLLIDQAGAMTELMLLPPAEPKRGNWEITNLGAVGVFDSCSECKRVVKHKAPFYNYCPNCGADMRGDKNA